MERMARMAARLSGIHGRIAKDAGLECPTVRCAKCGYSETVDGGHCLAHGWPLCCGEAMLLAPTPEPAQTGKEGE